MMSKSIRAPIGQECHSTTSFKCQLRLHFYILDRIRVYNKAKECDPVFPLYEIHVGRDPPWPLRLNACISPEQIHWPPKTTASMVLRSSRLLFYIYSLRNLPHRPLSPVLLMLTWSRFKAALDFEERHTSHVAYPSHEKTRISLHVSFQHDIPLLFEIYTQTNAFHGSLLADRAAPFQRVSVPFQSVFSRNSRFGSWIDRCLS